MGWTGVTDKQWEKIRIHIPPRTERKKGGRPPVDDRKCFDGILWIAWTGAPWSALPKEYGSSSTCWRRLRDWEEQDVFLNLWRALLAELDDEDKLCWDECFADGSFAPAKKGATKSARPNAARAQSGWWWSMARVLRWEHTWTRPRRRK
jgi:transposase